MTPSSAIDGPGLRGEPQRCLVIRAAKSYLMNYFAIKKFSKLTEGGASRRYTLDTSLVYFGRTWIAQDRAVAVRR